MNDSVNEIVQDAKKGGIFRYGSGNGKETKKYGFMVQHYVSFEKFHEISGVIDAEK